MSDSNDLSELNSRVEQAVCLLQSFQEQQNEVEAQVRDQLTRTLQVIRQQQQELKRRMISSARARLKRPSSGRCCRGC